MRVHRFFDLFERMNDPVPIRIECKLVQAACRHQAYAGFLRGLVNRLIQLHPVETEIHQGGEAAAQGLQENPFGRCVGRLRRKRCFHRIPYAFPNLRRFSAYEGLPEGLAGVGMRVNEAGNDSVPGKSDTLFGIGLRYCGNPALGNRNRHLAQRSLGSEYDLRPENVVLLLKGFKDVVWQRHEMRHRVEW